MSCNVPMNTSHNYDAISSFFTWVLIFLKRSEILPTGVWFLHLHFGGQKPKKSYFNGHNMNFRDCTLYHLFPERKLTLNRENYSWTTFHSQSKTKKPNLHSGSHTKTGSQLRYATNTIYNSPGVKWLFLTNLKVAYTWNFFDGIISTGSLDHKTKECHFVPLGHFPEIGQIHNGGSRLGLP